MTYEDQIVDYLKADVPLMAIATGGVFNYPETGRKGLARLLTPTAFTETDDLLKPTVMVLGTKEIADEQISDPRSGYNSTVTPVFIWVYDKGTTKDEYTNIVAICDRLYQLLAYQQLANMFQILYEMTVKNKREKALKEAAFYMVKYNVYGSRKFA